MSRYGRRALWSSKRPAAGVTFIELLVTLVILSILAAAAIPYAELTVRRTRELELHRALRTVRTAIDRFHEDWETGRISHLSDAASVDGYPRTLQVLVQGVPAAGPRGGTVRYLRRIPRDPFANPRQAPTRQWALRGYQDFTNAPTWDGKDVYDIHSRSPLTAINGTHYRDW